MTNTKLDANPEKDIRVWVRKSLVAQVKDTYRETKGLTASGLVDWALRYVVLLERKLPIVNSERKREEAKNGL